MEKNKQSIDSLINELKERTKELNCLYSIEEWLNKNESTVDEVLHNVTKIIPQGFQFPDFCEVKLTYWDKVYKTKNFVHSPWYISSPIRVQDQDVGNVIISYSKEQPNANLFNKEEIRLLKTVTDRLGHFVLHQDLKNVFMDLRQVQDQSHSKEKDEWRVVLDMIRKTDPNLFMSILRKLLHQLLWNGIEEAEVLLKQSSIAQFAGEDDDDAGENKPIKKKRINTYDEYIEAILKLAGEYIHETEILSKIQKWIQDDKSSALVKSVETQGSSLADIGDAIRKYYHIAPEKFELSEITIKGLRVSLLRRFFTDELEFISVAKEFVKVTDFYRLIDKMIFPPASHGKLGGKTSGMFLAKHILRECAKDDDVLENIKIPKTWYMTSDGLLSFMQYNNLEEVLEQKYKEIDEVRLEYPHIVQVFKNSQFPPDLVKGISMALDDFDEVPLIVRSSSLLEDQMGASFSGKYKSLFLANQGSKQVRLANLMDAIAEVYASTFGPDPIEYRGERKLLDYHEEMGIMVQEVVGNKIGKYFLPSFAGVAFSHNEFRWSPRIQREDGLVRIVAGLGTRAVDRIGDDYPILITPGQPNLRVNVSIEEKFKYSQKKIDVINLETNDFETIDFNDLIKNDGDEFPAIHNIVSVLKENMLRQPNEFDSDFINDDLVINFEGLFKNTNFIKKLRSMLLNLEDKLQTPVDIEFASNGVDFYLLQCRPQSNSKFISADPIPKDIPNDKLLFTANRYISNGKVPEITHIVYVDPEEYASLKTHDELFEVGRAVGKLNHLLPKRKFILMGPGRWGSRGDIKLGVNVTYSDINNTAVLIEIARKRGSYVPDLSFGTHFFQDLVEASIRYLPLYPDDENVFFNYEFFRNSKNVLEDLVPEYSSLKNVIKVIDIPGSFSGFILRVLMNAEQDRAVALMNSPLNLDELEESEIEFAKWQPSDQWRWRYKMAEKIASELEGHKYGIKGLYVFGSTKNASAGPGSDIDLIVHIQDQKKTIEKLQLWFDGWSLCLSEMNYLRTGIHSKGLLDIHYVTDEDLRNRTIYAMKIGAVTDAARKLKLKSSI